LKAKFAATFMRIHRNILARLTMRGERSGAKE
jgi:hypothetical protein